MIYDIAIIGAGASGLMLSSTLNKKNKICLIDNNNYAGAKIKISGGSKCNITNKYMHSSHFLGNKDIVSSTLTQFSQKDLLVFLNKNGVYPKIDEKIVKGTYFCNSSNDVLNMFKKLTKHCHYKFNTKVLDVDYANDIFNIITTDKHIKSKKLIVASGGLSYSSLGATSIGYDIAKKFNHTIIKTNPALVGFTVQKDQFWFKSLSGLSLDVRISIEDKQIDGKMLFTHKGCSGPAILTTSLYWKKGFFTIDFLPHKDSYLPKRFRQAIKELNIDIHSYKVSPAGNFGYTKAEITKGGVNSDELTTFFESKHQKNLYFIGEVLDISGELGGYNFQWCFSSAVVLGKFLNKCIS
jgi:predicted Rossmann fold flavoprotein